MSNIDRFKALILELARFQGEELDSPQADALRDQMVTLWYKISEVERKLLRKAAGLEMRDCLVCESTGHVEDGLCPQCLGEGQIPAIQALLNEFQKSEHQILSERQHETNLSIADKIKPMECENLPLPRCCSLGDLDYAGKRFGTDAGDLELDFWYGEKANRVPIRLIAVAHDMLALLRELEWSGPVLGAYGIYEGLGSCPMCEKEKAEIHTSDCRLAALLRRAGGEA